MDTFSELSKQMTDDMPDIVDRSERPQPPILALAAGPTTPLTTAILTGKRWRLGVNGRGELTSSFYFGTDGRIKVFKAFNESSWRLENGVLIICDVQGLVSWMFELVFQVGGSTDAPGQLLLVSGYRKGNADSAIILYLLEHKTRQERPAASIADEGATPASGNQPEPVRLVIWDLDDTFWTGTLSESAVQHSARNSAIVDELNRRGIVSAICSKNDRAPVEAELRAAGLWDRFVFPEIAFAPKGSMVARIIRNSQLRAGTVMFVDDNVTNLNEAVYYSPGLQIAEPSILDTMLDDPRFTGKPDAGLQRLQRYKVLERKLADQAQAGSDGSADNEQFLRDSDIRVSLHTDVEAVFPRIHDLVNRTNQLNFTKNRWPDDQAGARDYLRAELSRDFINECGYVKVADRYGAYGICGFYLVSNGVCIHMLFSCRSMNMGVEQFVWARLGRPFVPISGEVISDIDAPVDWVRVVEDADVVDADAPTGTQTSFSIALFGACNVAAAASYLRQWFQVREEFNYPYHDWGIFSLPRIVASAAEANRPDNQALLARLPGMPPNRYESVLLEGTDDAYVISFSSESFCGHHRSRSTGLVVPMSCDRIGNRDFREVSYEEIRAAGVEGVSAEQWQFMQAEFEYVGQFDADRFAADVRTTLELVQAHGKPVVLLGLNETIGRDQPVLDLFGRVNAIATPIASELGVPVIDVANFVHGENDLTEDLGGPHYQRHVYASIAGEIRTVLQSRITVAEPAGA